MEKRYFSGVDRCVCCGAAVPEGRMVCIECESCTASVFKDKQLTKSYKCDTIQKN